MKVSFIGLGAMGSPMAAHLAKAGHEVTVYNRTASKADNWSTANGGLLAATPTEACAASDFVMICVGNDDDVRSVTTGPDGCLAAMHPRSVLIDHTTTSAMLARDLYQAAHQRGIGFLDAPVSGGQAGAEAGKLSAMVGGDEATFAAAEPVMRAYAATIVHIGPAGCGQLAKMVNQIAIAGVVQGLAEALNFAQRAGLDTGKLLQAIGKGAAGSWQMDNRATTMLQGQFHFGFAVDWMIKDLQHCVEEATRNGAALPVASEVLEFYHEISRKGGGRMDTSSLIERLS